jgi:hypothetical protein
VPQQLLDRKNSFCCCVVLLSGKNNATLQAPSFNNKSSQDIMVREQSNHRDQWKQIENPEREPWTAALAGSSLPM